MSTLEVISQSLKENAEVAMAPEAAPAPVVEAPEAEAPKAEQPMTYEDRVKKNLESSHDRIELTKEFLSKYGEELSAAQIELIIEEAESSAKVKIMKPGYDPSKYTDIIKTDSELLLDRIIQGKRAYVAEKEHEEKIDYINAVDEFGRNNIAKKDEALKWYADTLKIPLENVKMMGPEAKANIYKSFNNNNINISQSEQDMRAKTREGLSKYLGINY